MTRSSKRLPTMVGALLLATALSLPMPAVAAATSAPAPLAQTSPGGSFWTRLLCRFNPSYSFCNPTAPPTTTTTTTGAPTTTSTTTPPGSAVQMITRSYPALRETDPGLRTHTIYRPTNLTSVDRRLPIVAMGNGSCSADGTMFEPFLTRVAAHGMLIIASGTPGGRGTTTSDMLIDAIDWAIAENSRAGSKYQGRLDTSKVAVMGMSCGGLEAMDVSDDPRIDTTILWNSGIFPSGAIGNVDKSALRALDHPTAWFTGGPSDIADGNARDDYQRVSGIPAVYASYDDVGHINLISSRAVWNDVIPVAVNFLDYGLNSNAQARSYFFGPDCGLCNHRLWDIQSKNG